MGRDSKNEDRAEHWTKMVRPMMQTPAWRALSPTAQALYPWLKFEWKGPKANNNGKIRLAVRQAAECLGVRPNTAGNAFHELQAKGFLHVTEAARLGVEGGARATTYELTEIPLPGSDSNDGRRLYRNWREDADYSVVKAVQHRAKTRPKKTKPCIKNEDSTVLKFDTNKKPTYRK